MYNVLSEPVIVSYSFAKDNRFERENIIDSFHNQRENVILNPKSTNLCSILLKKI